MKKFLLFLFSIIFYSCSSDDIKISDNPKGLYSSHVLFGNESLHPATLLMRSIRAYPFSESIRYFSGFPNHYMDFASSALLSKQTLDDERYHPFCNGSLAQKDGKIYLFTAYHCLKFGLDGMRGDSLLDIAFREVGFSKEDRKKILEIAPQIYDGPIQDTRGSFSALNFGNNQGEGRRVVFHAFSLLLFQHFQSHNFYRNLALWNIKTGTIQEFKISLDVSILSKSRP